LAGIVLAAITVFIIERDFIKASAFAVAGAIFTFFGLIHAEALGFGQTPSMVVSYLGVAIILYGCAKYARVVPRADEAEAMHGHGAVAKPAE
jgi:AGZA family xanthine/uracil permease-like MFS transporter